MLWKLGDRPTHGNLNSPNLVNVKVPSAGHLRPVVTHPPARGNVEIVCLLWFQRLKEFLSFVVWFGLGDP